MDKGKYSMQKGLSENEIKEIILRELPKLIKKDTLTRQFIIQLVQERFAEKKRTEDRFEALLKEIKVLREESEKRWQESLKRFDQMTAEWNKKWEENQKRLERMEMEWNKKWEENQKRLERMEMEWNKKWEENQKRLEQRDAEWNKKWEENQKRLEQRDAEWNKKWEENQKRLERMEMEWNKKWEENQKVINQILEEIKLLHRRHDISIGALGARWGLRAEGSFRSAMKGILEESFPLKVERYMAKDEEGYVFGRPDQVELDLIVKDGEVMVAEIKSSISKGDVATFIRKVEFFTRREGRPVRRKLLISPMIEGTAKEFAESSGIEVYGYPEEVELQELQGS